MAYTAQSVAMAVAALAAVLYIVLIFAQRGPPEGEHLTSIIAWVLLLMVTLVVMQTTSACPAEEASIKVFYGFAILLLLANAIMEVTVSEGRKDKDGSKVMTWVSAMVTVAVIVIASLRTDCWARAASRLSSVRSTYRSMPGDDRFGIADSILAQNGYSNGQMKRMLRQLTKTAKRSGSRRL
jgi:hypothetical protein